MSDILAITSNPDIHLEMVQSHLDKDILVFDLLLFPNECDITYQWVEDRFIITSNERIFNDVNSIWYRKPRYLNPADFPVEPEYEEFTYSAYEQGITCLYTSLCDKLWVSDVWSIQKATRNKVYQIEQAYKFGMNIPRTLVTSVPKKAKDFLYEQQKAITKSLGNSAVLGQGLFFTTRIRPEDDIDFEGLSIAPAIFQEEVDSVLDLRVTVVGDEVFPCEIKKTGNIECEVDWNIGTYTEDIVYGIHSQFPDDLKSSCIRMLSNMGLKYGAFDFVLDKNGKYWFIEVNPNGQWAFVEYETALPIAKSIAKLLTSSNT